MLKSAAEALAASLTFFCALAASEGFDGGWATMSAICEVDGMVGGLFARLSCQEFGIECKPTRSMATFRSEDLY